jgi:type IX secretion system substrate protein
MKTIIYLAVIIAAMGLTEANAQVQPTDTDNDGIINISTLDHLRWISENDESWSWDFELDNDIDASDTKNWNFGNHDNNGATPDSAMGWIPIGNTPQPFQGNFDGQNFSIKNLYIFNFYNGGEFGLGFFGVINSNSSIIENLKIINCQIYGVHVVGGLSGGAAECSIINCIVSGNVIGYHLVGGMVGLSQNVEFKDCSTDIFTYGHGTVGGLIGESDLGVIQNCSSFGIVKSVNPQTTNQSIPEAGGLVGSNSSRVTNSFSKAKVVGLQRAGGLIGSNEGDVELCFTSGDVSGGTLIGGLISAHSQGIVKNCYSRSVMNNSDQVNGLIGINFSTIKTSYYADVQKSTPKRVVDLIGFEQETSIMLNCFIDTTLTNPNLRDSTNKSTSEMKTKSTFTDVGWDFETVWDIDPAINDGYPYLQGMKVVSVDEEIDVIARESFIYPNPADEMININTNGVALVKIYDLTGNLQLESRAKQINIAMLSSGTYFVLIKQGSKIERTMFIKR